MIKQDFNENISDSVKRKHLFSKNYIRPIRGSYSGKREQFENSLVAYNRYLRKYHDNFIECIESRDVYKWINQVLAGRASPAPNMTTIVPLEVLRHNKPAVKYDITIQETLYYMLEAVDNIEDEGFHFIAIDKRLCLQMQFGFSDIQMILTCVDVPGLHQTLAINTQTEDYLEKAIKNTLEMTALCYSSLNNIETMKKIVKPYAGEKFKYQHEGLLYQEGIFTPFISSLSELEYLYFVYEKRRAGDKNLQMEICGTLLIINYLYRELGVLKLLISLTTYENSGRLFRVYKTSI